MQPTNPNPYGNHQFTPNPYAQQAPGGGMVPVEMPKTPRALSGGVLVSFVLTILLLIGAIAFGSWAFMSRQDYKDASDKKVAAAVAQAKKDEDTVKAAEYAEQTKSPYKQYKGPATYGSVSIVYPKTWSALITEQSTGDAPIDGYFHPNYIPGITTGAALALRVRVVSRSYAAELASFDANAKKGTVKIAPYTAPKVSGVVGSRLEGVVDSKVKGNGVLVLLPVRDKTLEISTQSTDYVKDLDSIVLANLTFEP